MIEVATETTLTHTHTHTKPLPLPTNLQTIQHRHIDTYICRNTSRSLSAYIPLTSDRLNFVCAKPTATKYFVFIVLMKNKGILGGKCQYNVTLHSGGACSLKLFISQSLHIIPIK